MPISFRSYRQRYSQYPMSILISDPRAFKVYLSGSILIHLLAFRPNTDRLEIIVTDYTRNDRLNEKVTGDEIKLGLREDQKLVMKVDHTLFEAISLEYEKTTGSVLFEESEVDLDKNKWVDLSLKFCFLEIGAALTKNTIAFVNRAKFATTFSPGFDLFWERLCLVLIDDPHFKNNRDLLISSEGREIGEKIVKLRKEFNSSSIGSGSQDSAGPFQTNLKREELTMDELSNLPIDPSQDYNSLFRETLEPVSQADSNNSLNDNFFAKVNGVVPQQSRQVPEMASQEFLTQLGTLPKPNYQNKVSDFDISDYNLSNGLLNKSSESSYSGSRSNTLTLSLGAINQMSPEINGDIFKTTGRIVGYFPLKLGQLCSKLYIDENGEVTNSGPKLGALRLFICSDSSGTLTPDNSLSVFVPKPLVSKFFSCSHTEQLYTQIKEKEKDLKKLLLRELDFEIYLDCLNGQKVWIWRSEPLNNLI